jgi:LmbE family N-acetylglucosaminyl deacetylase
VRKSLVISAHLDDAVLSAGQFLAGHPNCDVLTVFSGIPMYHPGEDGEAYVTQYDLNCGFETSKDAMVTRRQEDREACAILNSNPYHTDRLDAQYKGDGDYLKLRHELRDWIKAHDYEMIIGPLGVRHPDHVRLSDLLIGLDLPILYLYEDLPHRVTHPELVRERLEVIENDRYNPELTFIGDGDIANKVRALWCYRSQIGRGDLNPYNLYVNERFWRV